MTDATSTKGPAHGLLQTGDTFRLTDLVPGDRGLASRVLARAAGGQLTLFAFAAGHGLARHTAPVDAFVTVVDGALDVTIDDATTRVTRGSIIRLPASVPHAVSAPEEARMLLVLLRDSTSDQAAT